jgi:CubicO group peptidase (beta-lactamase class C family)
MLTPYLARAGLPGLAAAVMKEGKIIAVGAVGTRRADAQVPVTVNDRFHLGSDTKAFTALLAAILVEEGRLRWDSTLAEVFPEFSGTMYPDVRPLTLQQLLSHASGMAGDTDRATEIMGQSFQASNGNLDEMRYWMVSQWLREPLVNKAGTAFLYSNMGYVVAGVMAERVSGKTWEELVMERIFVPLGLKTAGFGPQASLGKTDAPVGHEIRDGKPKPMLAGPNGDNPVVIGPAGTSHMSVLDFAAWAGWNAGEGKRGPALVRPETLKRLHTPVIAMPPKKDAAPGTPSRGKYGLGWGEIDYDWASRPLLYHGGSNGKNLAHILLDPAQDFGMVLVTNVASRDADRAFSELEEALYRRFATGK